LRASGVISSHFLKDLGNELRIFRKSDGILCTTPEAISFLDLEFDDLFMIRSFNYNL